MRFPGFGDGFDFRQKLQKASLGGSAIHKKTIGRTRFGKNYDPLSDPEPAKDPPPAPPPIQRTPDTTEAARLRRLAEPNRRGERAPLIGGEARPSSTFGQADTIRLGE